MSINLKFHFIAVASCDQEWATARSEHNAKKLNYTHSSPKSCGRTPSQARRYLYPTQGIKTVSKEGVTVKIQKHPKELTLLR